MQKVRSVKRGAFKRRTIVNEARRLYAQAQKQGAVYQTYQELHSAINNSPLQTPQEMSDAAVQLLVGFTAEVSTLQVNNPDHLSYRVYLRWEDRRGKPRYGWQYPTLAVVKSSPSLALSVILAYTELCANAGCWIK